MKNRLAYLFLGIFGLVGLASCESQLEDVPGVKTRTVFFSSVEKDAATRTGITIENKVVTPDWRKTKAANVHLFETGNDGGVSTGEDVEITVASDNLTASFKADFPAEWTIIVDPTEPTEEETKGGGTKAASNAPYTYSAVVAQKSGESFIVPSVQYPDAETLIDPDADFLIGYSKKSYGDPHDYTENVVDLYFDRPVALSRITVTNFEEGEKVKSVTIKAQSGLTGSAAYNAIDFENAKVTFTPGTESGTIELSYGNGIDIEADGTFEAYFVSLPGTITITELAVATDKYNYVKTIEGGKEFTFTTTSLKPIKFDLTTATKEEATPDNTVWYKASVLEDGIDYLIVSGGQALKNNDGSTAGVAVTDNAGVITFETEVDPALVWTATAHQETTGDNGQGGVVAGHFTLTNNGYYLLRDSQEITLGDAIPSAKPKYAVWDYDGTYLRHESSETMTFYCYYDGGWATGYTQNGAAPGSSIKTVQIYTSRTPQTMTFSESTVNYDVDAGGDFVEPTLEGAKTAVTYSSSNEAVASVDPSTGAVTIKKAGTVTITATAAGNAEYQAGTASYTIVATSGAIDTFYLASEIVAGESYMVVSGGYAVTTDGSTLGTVPVTVNDGIIQISASEVALFEAAAHIEYYEGTSPAGHYTLANGGKYLQRHSDQATQTGAIGAENGKYYVWEYDGEHLYQISRTGNNGTYYFYYSSGWTFDYQSVRNAYLYTTTKQLQPQHLSFSSESVTAVLGQPFTAPTLSGVKTTVSYASSDASVATVASDGAVTIVGIGTTTITATAAASDEYNAGSASYTLKVTDGNVPTWYKADEIEAGETYLVVSHGYILKNDGSTGGVAIDLGATGDSFEYEADEAVIWTATESSGKFRLNNGGKVLRLSGSSFQIGTASGTESNNQCVLNDEALLMISSYYVYYSTSQSKWAVSNSASDSHTGYLYGLNPGRQQQELVFSETSVNYDIATGGSFTAPTLSGAQTDVTYTSSKPAVATVDAATGAVEIVGTGTTIITASAEGTSTIKPATASYTIHVTDSSSPVTEDTYVKVTSASDLVAGSKYILVYEDGPKVFKPTLNGSNFTTTGNALDVIITDGTIVSDDFKDCQLTLEDGYYFYVESVSRYLYPTYNNMGAEETKSSSHSFSISISSGTSTISRTSNNTTYNLRYSTSSSYFQSSTSSANVALYKLEDN